MYCVYAAKKEMVRTSHATVKRIADFVNRSEQIGVIQPVLLRSAQPLGVFRIKQTVQYFIRMLAKMRWCHPVLDGGA